MAEIETDTLRQRQSLVGSLCSIAQLVPEARVQYASMFRYLDRGGVMGEDMANFWRTLVKRLMRGCDLPVPESWLPGDCTNLVGELM